MSRFTRNTGLAILCTAQFVVVLDATIVATALPAIGADLGFRLTGLSWVVTAYTIALAGMLIAGGRAADLAGARRMFRVGLVVFAVASAACALAGTPATLIAARVGQGAGAALLSPAALAALHELIGAPEARRRALGWWTAAGAGGGASGWVLGGMITELAGWRWVFAVNVPIGLLALVLAGRFLPGMPPRTRAAHRVAALDLPGSALATGGIAVSVLALTWIGTDVTGWPGWLAVVGGLVVLGGFVRHENLSGRDGRGPAWFRRADEPLLPRSLLRRPGVAGGNLTAAALTGSTTPAMLTVVLYVQDTLRLSPARGALLFPAFNLAVIAGSMAGPRLSARAGNRRVLLGGFVAVVAGIALLLCLPAAGRPAGVLIAAFGVMGAGLGAASVASTAAGTAAVPAAERGVAAGLLASTAQLGTAVGLAVTAPVVASAAPMAGYRWGFATAAAVGVAGALAASTVPRRLPAPSPVPEAAAAETALRS
jgi:MFS family permease